MFVLNIIQVVVGAPARKAAFGVGGYTLHSLFALPANQALAEYHKLDHSTLKVLRILIIDEVSMVGVNMFNFINRRLQDIFGTYSYLLATCSNFAQYKTTRFLKPLTVDMGQLPATPGKI
ncbi:hypothetical protein MAR_024923 [Mya arenaria]|uniref:DNA helicase n=1 Tax=Mya arenaria TaxID=6604 RepID=A0ABY7E059_MYAAR|nr:hypothetical protein MAR_024923 [Mya arenaria]